MHSKIERWCRPVFNRNAESYQEYFSVRFQSCPIYFNWYSLKIQPYDPFRFGSYTGRNRSLKQYESTGCATPSRRQYVINFILTPLIKRDTILGSRRWIHSTFSVRQWSPLLSVLLSLPLKNRTNCKNSLAWRRLAHTFNVHDLITWVSNCCWVLFALELSKFC